MDGAINRMIESLVAVSKARNTEETGFAYGTIRSLNPLSVLVDGHSSALPEEFFILGQNVRPHKVTIPHKHAYNGITELGVKSDNPETTVNPPHIHLIEEQVTEDLHTPINPTTMYNQEYVIIDIYPPLSVGDRVIMLRSNDGQKYYILERVEQ